MNCIAFCYRFKDDIEVREEDGFDIVEQDDFVSLSIKDVEMEDAGSYVVEFKNSAGLISKTFVLNVSGMAKYEV